MISFLNYNSNNIINIKGLVRENINVDEIYIYKYTINYYVRYETLDGVKPNILLLIKQLGLLEIILVLHI